MELVNEIKKLVVENFDDSGVRGDVDDVLSKGYRSLEDLNNMEFKKTSLSPSKLNQWFDRAESVFKNTTEKALEEYKDITIQNSEITIDRIKLRLKNKEIDGKRIGEKQLYFMFDEKKEKLENDMKSIRVDCEYKDLRKEFNIYSKKLEKAKGNAKISKFLYAIIPVLVAIAFIFYSVMGVFNEANDVIDDAKDTSQYVESFIKVGDVASDFFEELANTVGDFFSLANLLIILIYIIYLYVAFSSVDRNLRNKSFILSKKFYETVKTKKDIIISNYNENVDKINVELANVFIKHISETLKQLV